MRGIVWFLEDEEWIKKLKEFCLDVKYELELVEVDLIKLEFWEL